MAHSKVKDGVKVQCEKTVIRRYQGQPLARCKNFFIISEEKLYEFPHYCNVHRHRKGYPA